MGTHDIALHEETQRRYLNYALSVITSRALPDVRDGLKPVQRRILYAMFHALHLAPDGKHRKSATIVGAVLGQFHPHGDSSVYEAMVRMAQGFSLRYPLVDGYGNFGSLDGDSAAAYRYTEARLSPLALELLEELRRKTVDYRPNFDGTTSEPIVLPARFPHLLVNGCSGIAVGMATNVPPHHLGEVIDAAVALIDQPAAEVKELLKHVRGPDFPTGGQVLNTKAELRAIYEAGQGTVRLRADYKVEELPRGGQQIVVTGIPYGVDTNVLVEKIAQVILAKNTLPQLVDVRNESTQDVRVVLELRKGADPQMVLAYLFKHTPLQTNFNVNLTCLIPTDNPEVAAPLRLDLRAALRHFLDFRLRVVTRRFEHDLEELRRRIHLLEGFERIYDALDEALRIIRKADGKADAAAGLIKRFGVDEEQADAILELKLYKLAKLEILAIRAELDERRKEARRIEKILKSEKLRWDVIRQELVEVRARYADKRRTRLGGAAAEELEFDPEAFIIEEDAHVVVTRDGWVKRVRELRDPTQTRLREGDEVLAALAGSTKATVAFFTSQGTAYVSRVNDIPPSTGYGDPVQKLFKMRDGERVVAALSLDARLTPRDTVALAVTRGGLALRFALEPHLEPSTRAGRRFAKLADGDEILGVEPARDADLVAVATEDGRALVCRARDVNLLAGAGKGVALVKCAADARALGFSVGEPLLVETSRGKQLEVGRGHAPTARGGRGFHLVKRDRLVRALPRVRVSTLAPPAGGGAP